LGRPLSLSDEAIAWVKEQDWPGNVRELENAIERAAVLSNNEALEPTDFSPAPRTTAHALGGTLEEAVEAAEREAITAALAGVNGNRREAAKALGVSLRTLFYKIERYGIS
jgi:DNA-binding NtrC family response regulator